MKPENDMASQPVLLHSHMTVGDLRALMKNGLPRRRFAILHSNGQHLFEAEKLGWLIEGVPDEVSLADALDLSESQPAEPPDVIGAPASGRLEELFGRGGAGAATDPMYSVRSAPPPAPSSAAAPAPVSTSTPGDYVNFGFYEIKRLGYARELSLNEGFLAGSRYRLSVRIDSTPDPRFGGEGGQPPIVRPANENALLHVAVFARNGPLRIIGPRLKTLLWNGGPTESSADFAIEAGEATALAEGSLDVFIYHRANVIYIGRFRITVAPEDYEWSRGGLPIRWDYSKDTDRIRGKLFRQFSEVGLLFERALSLVIQRGDAPDQYILTALAGRAELPARLEITREEVASFLLRTRERMDRLRRHPVYRRAGYDQSGTYTGAITGTASYDRTGRPVDEAAEAFRAFLDDMAVLGSHACDRLFQSEDGQVLRAAVEGHLVPGDVIQVAIETGAREFVWPWPWLYSESFDPSHRFRTDPNLFWGYKYVIEQVTGLGDFIDNGPATPRIEGTPVRVRVGFWNFEPETRSQMEYFQRASDAAGQKLECTFWDDDARWEEFLPKCDSHLLYFFTHGHTAKPRTLGAIEDYNMFEAWRKWASEAQPGESESMKTFRERSLEEVEALEGSHNLLDESFIRLRRGMLLLRELYTLMNLRQSHPLVFLNMCESAQVFPLIKGGLIDAFLEKGARAVIGTEIPMLSSFADLYSREFFDALLFDGAPVGEILHRLRRKYLDVGNPLAFAYTLFGDAMVAVGGLAGRDKMHAESTNE